MTVLTLSGGEQGGVAAERALESQRAADLMGARLVHADLADTSVSEGGATIATIKAVIDEIHPTTVYTHTSKDVHQDHRNVHSATLVAARGIPRIYCYQAPSTTVDFKPTRFVAIDEYLERKLEVIRAYALADRRARLSRRGAPARDRALLGPLHAGALRRAARGRARERRPDPGRDPHGRDPAEVAAG